MPLSALLDGESIYAFDLDDDAAKTMASRVSHGSAELKMVCGRRGFLRRSRRGTLHFVHGRTEEVCAWPHASMTEEHMAAQRIIIEAARAAGWEAVDEVAGGDEKAGRWRTDVMAAKGPVRVAFEVQWSRQSDYRYEERQEAYARVGVRGAWFARGHRDADRHLFAPSKDTPIFRLSDTQPFTVRVSSKPAIPLAEAVTGLLRGRWRFEETAPAKVRTRIIAVLHKCFHCGKWMTVHAVDSVIAVPLCADAGADPITRHRLDWPLPNRWESGTSELPELAAALRTAKLPPLAPIQPRTTRNNADFTTHMYGCPNCPRRNASPDLSEKLHRYRTDPKVDVTVERMEQVILPHWCSSDHLLAST